MTMGSNAFDTLKTADWHVKGLLVGAILLASLLAKDFIDKLWLSWRLRKYPIVNRGKPQREFMTNAESIMREGLDTFKGQPFRVDDFSQSGPKLLLPAKYIDEVKSNPACDIEALIIKDHYANYPGFEPFAPANSSSIFQDAIRKELSQVLSLTIPPMAVELPNTLSKVLGHSDTWTEIQLQSVLLRCVSRLTSNVFLGPKYMENPDWQHLSTQYVKDMNAASQRLNRLPPLARPIVHWFLPECRTIRAEVDQARALIRPEVERRLEELRRHGGPRRRVLDSVDWFIASMRGKEDARFDIAAAEVTLAMASISTTTRTAHCFLRNLLTHPGYIQDLRDEFVAVLRETGTIDKKALMKMRKMDSVLRETMRVNPPSIANMPRLVKEDVRFKDGTVIPKGACIMMYPYPGGDPELYPEPERFDGYRFLRAREGEKAENRYQAVTTGADLPFFGHGAHACPGRFLAINEIKLLVIHLLLHYDWDVPKTQGLLPIMSAGTFLLPDGRQKVLYRSREPEVDVTKFHDLDLLDI